MNNKSRLYGENVSRFIFFKKKLEELGFENRYIGFYYIIEILNLVINQDFPDKCLYKTIYPLVAEKFNKKPCTVERNIRIVIDSYWLKYGNSKMKYFLSGDIKPTCRKLIRAIKSYILAEIN